LTLPAAVAVQDFRKDYGGRIAVDGVGFEVAEGEVFALLGPNGAGKSTIVRALVGIQPPTSGRVRVFGFDMGAEPVKAKELLGYVPETTQLYESLTAREYLTLAARLHRIPDAASRVKIERFLEIWNLAESADEPLASFSKGMKQKVAILAALVSGPRLLVLDEPMSGLDAEAALVLRALVREHAARGGTVFYTSHVLDVVEKVASRVAVLVQGKLAALGTLDEIRAQAGVQGDLGAVFESLARTGDPVRQARALLDESARPAAGLFRGP
jgi:ABC-2 type transport system ATP-binding protein